MTILMSDHIRAPASSTGYSHLHHNPLLPTLDPIPSVEKRVSASTEIWARDLRSLFEHAKERFGDVTWESEEGGERIWAHKAVIYARAPKTFKERYFPPRSFSRSPHFTSPAPSPTPYLPSHLLNGNGHGHGHGHGNGHGRYDTPSGQSSLHAPRSGTESSLSIASINSENTIRGQGDAVLRLTHGDTPELFSAQLEWLYTGEGFGDVVEWIEEDTDTGGSIRDSLGRRGDIHDRRDKLGQDLTYMWRSKLYVDVRIHLTPQASLDSDDDGGDDSDSSTDSLSSTAVFTSHRFILCSRSPYFASVLLNPSFKPQSTADIHLPTPPFTPAALHFCLGYMYAGHLDFSNRTFDLSTAFAIYRAAMYLQLEALVQEIESRIVHDFCHGLNVGKCKCRRCPLRAARVWRFSIEPDIGAIQLRDQAKKYVIDTWGQSWGREVGMANVEDKDMLIREICGRIKPDTMISTWRNVQAVRTRMENGSMAKGREASVWVEPLGDMIERVESRARDVLIGHFALFADSAELWTLVSGKGFDGEILEIVAKETVDAVGTAKGCIEGPKVYQYLVSSLLLKVDPDTLGPALPPRSRSRQQIEETREGVLAHIRRRWMQIRDAGGFHNLENWALKEISDEIDVSVDELLGPSALSPLVRTRLGTGGRPTSGPGVGIPRTTSRVMSLSDAASIRTTTTTSTQTSSAARPPALRADATTEAPGLRRLRLSSSASTSSVTSARSARSVSGPVPTTAPLPGTASARSPTAAREGPRVSIGSARGRNSESPTPSTRQGRQMSGPIRPLMARPSPAAAAGPSSASVTSVSTTRTSAAASASAIPRATTSPKSPTKTPTGPTTSQTATTAKRSIPSRTNAVAGPSRQKSPTPSLAPSVRKVARPKSPTPSLAPSIRKAARPKSPTPSTASVRTAKSRSTSTPSTINNKPAATSASTVSAIRNRIPSTASQASTTSKVSPVPTRAPAARPTIGSTVRSRAAAINAQNGAAAPRDPKPTIRPTAKAAGKQPIRTMPTESSDSRQRSPSVSSVASAASRRSIGTGTRTTSRLAVPIEPVPVRNRSVSSTVTGSPSAKVTPTARRKTSTSTLRNQVLNSDSPKSAPVPPGRSAVAPTSSSGTKARSTAAARPFPVISATGSTASSNLLSATQNTTRSVALGTETQGLRSPSGSTDETVEAITPRLDVIALEPIIKGDDSDPSEPSSSHMTPKEELRPELERFDLQRPARATRKTSQTSTRSTASSLRPHPASAFDPPRRDLKPAILSALTIPDGSEPFHGPGVALRQGIGCIVSLDKKRARFRAMIKYIGLLKDSSGPWIGIETDDLDRFGVKTLETGSKDGVHYFHLSPPPFVHDTNRTARQRKLDLIRQSLGKRASVFIGSSSLNGGNEGLGIPKFNNRGAGKRSISPFAGEHATGQFERPRALFIRPHEVVFVLGAE